MTMKPYIQRDLSPEKAEHSSWLNARNMLLSKGFKTAKNEKGTTLEFTLEFPINGIKAISDGFIVFSTDNTWSEIGVVKEGIYTKKLRTAHLGFNIVNPIECVYKYNYNKELIIAFTDATQEFPLVEPNNPWLLNLDNLPFKGGLTTALELNTIQEIGMADLFPDRTYPNYTYNSGSNETGGKLLVGTYYIALAYYIDEFDTTGIFSVSRPFYVIDSIYHGEDFDSHNIGWYQKAKTGDYISSSLPIKISNLDINYKYVEIYTIFKTQGTGQFAPTGKIIGKYLIDDKNADIEIIISTLDNKIDIDLNYVLLYNTTYKKVKTMSVLENKLYLGNLHTEENIYYQKYANNIEVTWSVEGYPATEDIYTQSGACSDMKALEPEEVYAAYIGFIRTDGTYTNFFHVPGRISRAWQHDTSFNETNTIAYVKANGGAAYIGEEDEIHDDAKVFHTKDTGDTPLYPAYGKLGYWENETEVYPNSLDFDIWDSIGKIGTLREEKVRHHKMPSLYQVSTLLGLDASRIKLKFDNIYIPTEIADKITHVVFAYAKRNFSNSTVISNGTLISQEWWINTDIAGNPPPYRSTDEEFTNNPRFYSYNMLWQKPNVSPRYKVDVATIFTDKTLGSIYNPNDSDRGTDIVKALEYHPDDNIATTPTNDRQEAYVKLYMNHDYRYLTPYPFNIVAHTYRIVSLKNYIVNAYSHFYEQSLVLMSVTDGDGIKSISAGGAISAITATLGDTYVNKYLLNGYVKRTTPGIKLRDLPVRESGSCNIHTRFYEPRVYDIDGTGVDQKYPFNIYENNLDYVALHNAKITLPYNPVDIFLDKFPNRMAVSIQQLEEFKGIAWREFLTSHYFETTKNRGIIWNIDNDTRDLLIECKFGTFTAQKKDELKISDNVVAALGDADIFATTPKELIPDEIGYVGCQSQFASYRVKIGNIIVDRSQGKIFLYNQGKVREITSKDMRTWFKDTLEFDSSTCGLNYWLFGDSNIVLFDDDDGALYNDETQSNIECLAIDNPFNDRGISSVWDESNERLIFSKNNGITTSYAISYVPEIEKWICFHDYTPNGMLYNRYGVYLTLSNVIHSLNTGEAGKYFGSTYPSYIDVVLNDPKDIEKLVNSIQWVTEVYNNSSGVNEYDKTFTHIVLFTYNQHSDKITLLENTALGVGNMRKIRKGWNFNDFRDILNDKKNYLLINRSIEDSLVVETLPGGKKYTDWWDKGYFINNFIVVRLIYDNVSTHNISIHDVSYLINAKR